VNLFVVRAGRLHVRVCVGAERFNASGMDEGQTRG